MEHSYIARKLDEKYIFTIFFVLVNFKVGNLFSRHYEWHIEYFPT